MIIVFNYLNCLFLHLNVTIFLRCFDLYNDFSLLIYFIHFKPNNNDDDDDDDDDGDDSDDDDDDDDDDDELVVLFFFVNLHILRLRCYGGF